MKNKLLSIFMMLFTVACNSSNGRAALTKVKNIPLPVKIEGSWDVEFLKENDYQAKHTFDGLSDWKDSENENMSNFLLSMATISLPRKCRPGMSTTYQCRLVSEPAFARTPFTKLPIR